MFKKVNCILQVIYFIFFISLINFSCSSGKGIYDKVPFDRITLTKNDTLIQFYTKPVDDKAPSNIAEDRLYTWYRADSILVTRGSYSGKLLHGDYLELFPNRALKQKGKYSNGLKEGKWQSWFQNGERESVITWNNGVKVGKFELYNAEGKLQKNGNYKAGKEDGEFSDFQPNGKTHKITYKQGAIIRDTIINKM